MKAGPNWSAAAISDRFPRVQTVRPQGSSVGALGGLKEGTGRVRTSPAPSQGGCSDPGCTCTSCAGAASAFWAQARHPFAAAEQTQGAGRAVSGDWLAEVMRLDAQTAAMIAGQQVALDAEAWGAVRAAQRARVALRVERARIARKRQEIWPGGEGQANLGLDVPNGLEDRFSCLCRGVPLSGGGPRYVDSEAGNDSHSGTLEILPGSGGHRARLTPWRTLRQVQTHLQDLADRAMSAGVCIEDTEIYLRLGRTWDGTEETSGPALPGGSTPAVASAWDGMSAILGVEGFRATAASPLILSSYTVAGGADSKSAGSLVDPEDVILAAKGDLPLLSGTRIAGVTSRTTAADYKDDRVGISFLDCCHVAVSFLAIRGFGVGIDIRGHSKYHTYSNLVLSKHSVWGIRFGVNQADEGVNYREDEGYYQVAANSTALGDALDLLVANGDYPAYIDVSGCTFQSIGYDTAGADVMIGFLATNCTISGNYLWGDAVRGIAGIESAGGSSGHLIDGNIVWSHMKFCWFSKNYLAEFLPDTSPPLLLHPCSGEVGSGLDTVEHTTYGYDQLWYPEGLLSAVGIVPPSGKSANGENGIAMKAMRPRTPTSMSTTHIRNNVIWGHTNFNGIVVYEGCQGVHVSGNQIFQNGAGILVSNQCNDAWYDDGDADYYLEKTRDVYIYENVIYMNQREGVLVNTKLDTVKCGPNKGTSYVFQVSDVYIYWNTIAHNLYQGVRVANNIDDPLFGVVSRYGDLTQIYLTSNVIVRNGRGADDPYRTQQVRWEGKVSLQSPTPMGANIQTCWSDYNCYLGWDSGIPSWSSYSGDIVIFWAEAGSSNAYQTKDGAFASWAIEEHGTQLYDLADFDFASESELEYLEGDNGDALSDQVYDGGLASTLRALDYTLGSESQCTPAGVVFDAGPRLSPGDGSSRVARASLFEPRTVLLQSVRMRMKP